jgi:DNA-binding Lrp family transcriptional regulator
MEPNKLVAQLSPEDRALVKLVQNGLPIVSRPYADIADRLSITEEEVIQRLQKLINNGAIKRYGVVVRHRELGYKANGMVVWDVPDDRVSELGTCIGRFSCVTLSYRRPRRLPDWPYNLFTMVHGRNREEVEEKVAEIVSSCGLQDINHTILFSTRRFKQRGASYMPPMNATRPAASIRLKAVEETPS